MRFIIAENIRQLIRSGTLRGLQSHPSCRYSTGPLNPDEITSMLSKPSWSVKSLLDNGAPSKSDPTITQKQLHHLLRLSALPLPKTVEEESKMIQTLESQLHFVRAIKSVDTTGVQPLQSIRDETKEAAKENEITLESLQGDLAKEEVVGRSRRIRRKKDHAAARQEEDRFDPLAQASKRIGRYIVVQTSKD
ncbi:hypothetical protein MMC18_001288 [Xylographa bjoerkii]|nr:hypothetical protein [Xylographa bjoerkii]